MDDFESEAYNKRRFTFQTCALCASIQKNLLPHMQKSQVQQRVQVLSQVKVYISRTQSLHYSPRLCRIPT